MAEFLAHAGLAPSGGYYPWPFRSGDMPVLQLSFYRLGAYENRTIQIQVAWELVGDKVTVASGFYADDSLSWEAGDPSSAVAGLNAALEALAEQIAAAISQK
jgi:hypothetical protein